ncbi:S1 family peptidase [Bdellovibrio sp. HCB290]|uniref:S1 family peptidase n=1 Tax=Bdellovibrio sp. HCB290 TaxID=3394356 RepID=UPI0039B68BDC
MKSYFIISLATIATLSACTGSKQQGLLNVDKSRSAIINGDVTIDDQAIAHTTVYIQMPKGMCTGSVLAQDLILTAGHCVTSFSKEMAAPKAYNPEAISVFEYHSTEVKDAKGNSVSRWSKSIASEASAIVIHPFYLAYSADSRISNFAKGYDVALIKLKKPLPDFYRPVIISNDLDSLTKNQIQVAGFGAHAEGANSYDGKLRNGNITIDLGVNSFKYTLDSNTFTLRDANLKSSTTLLFKKESQDAAICHGDSGGPIYFEKDGTINLIAVNEGGEISGNCAESGNQVAVSLAGPPLRFVVDTFKALTGSDLGINLASIEKDPNTFEFQLASATVNPKNKYLSLEGRALIRGKNGEMGMVDAALIGENCEKARSIDLTKIDFYTVYGSPESKLDGTDIMATMVISNGAFSSVQETRIKTIGNIAKVVVHNADGYVSGLLPVINCATQ